MAQWNEIAQLWKHTGEQERYRVRRLCWTFRTPEESKQVDFTLSVYRATTIAANDYEEVQPRRPALYVHKFTTTVGTDPTVVTADIDFGL